MPNLRHDLEQFARKTGVNVTFNKEAHERFLAVATSADAEWSGNPRDLNAAATRMASWRPALRPRDEWAGFCHVPYGRRQDSSARADGTPSPGVRQEVACVFPAIGQISTKACVKDPVPT